VFLSYSPTKPIKLIRFWTVFLLFLSAAVSDAQSAPQKLRGHVPAAVSRLTPLGRENGSDRLRLAIGLPLRNQTELTNLLQQLYDPASPNYHHYLTPEEFTARFGPTEQDYQAVIRYAKQNGFNVTGTHPNRVVLDVEGAVDDIEKSFHLTMRTYQHPREARIFHAPSTEPTVDLGVPILHISGLDNYSLPHPNFKIKPLALQANAAPRSGSAPGGSYQGNDFRAAYSVGSLTGAGQSVGLLQFDGYYNNDIADYESQAGLPSVTLTNVPVDGGVSTPGDGVGEVSLDIEMVMSMAPGISRIIVYEAPNPSPWVDLLSRMANDNLAKQLSCSWGGGSPDPTSEQIFQQMAAQGQSFFNATGDSDAFTGAIDFPSDSTNVTQVGGTTLTTTGPGGSYVSETVWNWGLDQGSYVGSSGGVSTVYAIPPYQIGIDMTANQGSTTMRNVPDVALTGDNVYVIYDDGVTDSFGGTSCAAPLWAGFMALVNQEAAAAGRP
jgi:subtilase family serine protease